MPPGLSNYSRARSLDTITESDVLEKNCDKRYVWHNYNNDVGAGNNRRVQIAELQRVLEEESKTSSCSDLSAINSEESKGTISDESQCQTHRQGTKFTDRAQTSIIPFVG